MRFSSGTAERNNPDITLSAAMNSRMPRPRRVLECLLERINGESTQQLGIEVRGLLGKNLACERDVPDLLNSCRIHQKCDICFTRSHFTHGFCSIAQVT